MEVYGDDNKNSETRQHNGRVLGVTLMKVRTSTEYKKGERHVKVRK